MAISASAPICVRGGSGSLFGFVSEAWECFLKFLVGSGGHEVPRSTQKPTNNLSGVPCRFFEILGANCFTSTCRHRVGPGLWGGGRRPTFGECIERKSHEVKCPGGNYGEPPGQKRLPKSVSYISMFFHTRSQEGSPGARSGFSKGDLDSRSQRFLMLLSRSPAFGSASLANLRC